jgi:MFS transporter, DHA3 family, macrolide efflux protein
MNENCAFSSESSGLIQTIKERAGLSLLTLFKNRNFSIFFAGQSISRLGDSIYTLALVWMAHVLSNSTFLMSAVLAAGVIPRIVIQPVTGVLVERWSKKVTMMTADVLRGLLVTVLAIMAYTHFATAWMLIVLSFVLTTLSTLASPAYIVLQKVIVPQDMLLKANSVNQTVVNITQIAGPAVAGLLIGFGGLGISFAADAVSFGIAALSLLFVSVAEPKRTNTPLTPASIFGDIVGGMKIFLSFPMVKALTPFMLLYSFAVVAVENLLIVQFIANTLHVANATTAVGSVNASMAVGELVGSLLVALVATKMSREKLFLFNMIISAISVIGIGFAHSVLVIGILYFIGGVCMSMVNLAFFTAIQEAIPSEALGRVWAVLSAVFYGVIPVSQLLFGGIATWVPVGTLISALGLLGALAGASAFLHPAIRRGPSFQPNTASTPSP